LAQHFYRRPKKEAARERLLSLLVMEPLLVMEQQIAATDQDEHCGDAPQQDYRHGSLLSLGAVSRARG
jgi:hypothetical protein